MNITRLQIKLNRTEMCENHQKFFLFTCIISSWFACAPNFFLFTSITWSIFESSMMQENLVYCKLQQSLSAFRMKQLLDNNLSWNRFKQICSFIKRCGCFCRNLEKPAYVYIMCVSVIVPIGGKLGLCHVACWSPPAWLSEEIRRSGRNMAWQAHQHGFMELRRMHTCEICAHAHTINRRANNRYHREHSPVLSQGHW